MNLSSVLLLLGGLATFVHAASLAELAAELPACGLECIQVSIISSPCDMSNLTCICTDPTFAGLTQACVTQTCTVKESLTLARLQKFACGIPVQSQQFRFKFNAIVSCVLAEICVLLRVYSKITTLGKLRADDLFIIVAGYSFSFHLQSLPVGFSLILSVVADLGFGLNIWDIQPFERLYDLLKLFWIDQILYSVHLYSVKISLLCFLGRTFPSRSFRIVVIGAEVFVALACIATLTTTALQCLPASYNWTNWDGEHVGHCNDLNTQTYAFGAINMACDLLILVMPLPEVLKLQVETRQKVQLLAMFSLGIVVTVFSVIRLPFLVSLGKTSNPTWDYVKVTIWSIWETELGIVCASMPAIRHLFKKVWPNAMRTIKTVKMGSVEIGSRGTKQHEQGISWKSTRKDRAFADNKNYLDLDERSLIHQTDLPHSPGGNSSYTTVAQ